MNELLIGCDPEFFVKVKGKNVSAHGLVDGDKVNPFKLEGGAVQVDGTALEFNIDPARDEKEFLNNISMVLEQVRNIVPNKYEFAFDPVANYKKEVFDAIPNYAKELGCDPDYNAYSGRENNKPDGDMLMRTAAGHVHLGWTEGKTREDSQHFIDCRQIIAVMDNCVGLPLSILEPDNDRKLLYGKAGAFRPKPYGVEWRTASNFWLSDDKLRSMVYKQTQKAFNLLKEGELNNINTVQTAPMIDNQHIYSNEERLDYINKKDMRKLFSDEVFELIENANV